MDMTVTTTIGRVKHLNPDSMMKSPAFSQVIEVSGNARTIYIAGQNAVDRIGRVVGVGDIGKQAEQVMRNLKAALYSVDADLQDIVKMAIYIVQGQPLEPGYEAFLRAWGNREEPPTISTIFVAGLARPEVLLEIDAIAVVPS